MIVYKSILMRTNNKTNTLYVYNQLKNEHRNSSLNKRRNNKSIN